MYETHEVTPVCFIVKLKYFKHVTLKSYLVSAHTERQKKENYTEVKIIHNSKHMTKLQSYIDQNYPAQSKNLHIYPKSLVNLDVLSPAE